MPTVKHLAIGSTWAAIGVLLRYILIGEVLSAGAILATIAFVAGTAKALERRRV